MILQRARADTFADRLLQQRAPLREAPLERIGIAQARRDRVANRSGCRRHDRGPGPGSNTRMACSRSPWARYRSPRPAVGNDRCVPSACQRGEAERLLPVAPALGEGPERAQGPRQPRPGPDPQVCPGRARLPVRRLHVPPQQLGRPAEVADGIVCLPQVMGCLHLQGAVAERGRELEGLLARRHGAVGVSRYPEYMGHPGQHPSQPGPIVERPGQGLGLAQQGEAPPMLSQCASARLPTRGGARWPAPWCRRARAGARGPGGPARRRPPPRGTRRGRRPWRRPAGSRSRPCPTPRPAGHGAPGVRPARPPARAPAPRGPRQGARAAPAAAPAGGCRRPPRASGHA